MSKSDKESMSRAGRKKKKQTSPKKRGLWKKILLGIFGVLLAAIVFGAGLFVYYASGAPELTEEDLTGTYASEFVDRNGEVFFTLGGVEREYATFDDYPEVMLDAIMAIEDQRFLSHIGIDPIGIGRAAVGYVVNQEVVGGGSTITQQLIKNSVFSTLEEDQTLERKAQEAWLAIQLEQELSKEQIITLYLNRIHMGANVYGAATAAEEYYGKHVSELELHEAAMLAGLPRAPNYYSPYNNEEAATNRRWLVLEAMVDFGAITQEEADAAKEIPVTEGLQPPAESGNQLVSDHYIQVVLDEIEEKTQFDAYTAGLTIHTNYDPEAQQILYDVANTDEYVNFPNDELQTAMSLIDSTTGQITALIGGRNRESLMTHNFATDNSRGVGSTIKPLTVYGPAIELLQYSTYHQVYDEEPNFDFTWELGNYDNEFHGQMSMREALVDSRNVPTAKLFVNDLGDYHDEITEFLESVGINTQNFSKDGTLVPQNAINAQMTPLELASAYTAFANNGVYIEAHTITSIVTQQGEEIDLAPSSNQVMEDYTAYMINDMLKDVVDYYSASLTIPGYTHAAKTGTTNYTQSDIEQRGLDIPSDGVPDNWVVGYSPYYTMSVWVGYEYSLEQGNYLTHADGSRSLARYIYQAAISQLVQGLEPRDWQQPDSVVEHTVINGSDPAVLARPGSSNSVTELFVKGNEPGARTQPVAPEENNETEEETGPSLSAPTGLSASYIAASDDVSVSWSPYTSVNGNVEYVLSVNGNQQTVSGTEYVITNPPRGTVTLSLAVRYAGQTGPAATIQINVPGSQEEPEEPENPDEQEPEPEPDPDAEPEEPEEPEPEPEPEPDPDAEPEEPENPESDSEPEPNPNTQEPEEANDSATNEEETGSQTDNENEE